MRPGLREDAEAMLQGRSDEVGVPLVKWVGSSHHPNSCFGELMHQKESQLHPSASQRLDR